MGHTVYAMRWVIYDKIQQLKKLAKALREPERSIANALIYHIHQNISAVVYANPLPKEIEDDLIFMMLVQEKKKTNSDIDDLALACFMMMIKWRMREGNKF